MYSWLAVPPGEALVTETAPDPYHGARILMRQTLNKQLHSTNLTMIVKCATNNVGFPMLLQFLA